MTNNSHRRGGRHGSPQHQTSESLGDKTFRRRMLGLDADQVYDHLDLMSDRVQASERELSAHRAENERLKAELQRVRAELEEYEQVGDRVNEQVVQLFSQAQLVAEEMVQDVSRDARERIGQARAHERRIVEEAIDTAGQQVRSYAQTAQAQMQSVMDSFATEVDRLGNLPRSGKAASAAPPENDPLLDDFSDWQHSRNGSGPDHPGSG